MWTWGHFHNWINLHIGLNWMTWNYWFQFTDSWSNQFPNFIWNSLSIKFDESENQIIINNSNETKFRSDSFCKCCFGWIIPSRNVLNQVWETPVSFRWWHHLVNSVVLLRVTTNAYCSKITLVVFQCQLRIANWVQFYVISIYERSDGVYIFYNYRRLFYVQKLLKCLFISMGVPWKSSSSLQLIHRSV